MRARLVLLAAAAALAASGALAQAPENKDRSMRGEVPQERKEARGKAHTNADRVDLMEGQRKFHRDERRMREDAREQRRAELERRGER